MAYAKDLDRQETCSLFDWLFWRQLSLISCLLFLHSMEQPASLTTVSFLVCNLPVQRFVGAFCSLWD